MILWVHILLILLVAGIFMWLVRWESIVRGLMAGTIEDSDKMDLVGAREMTDLDYIKYVPDGSVGNMGFQTTWDFISKCAIIIGPPENISTAAISHELGHVRAFMSRMKKGKRPMVLDIEKNWLNRKLGTMTFYEYFVEKDAWGRCGYLHSASARFALKRYWLRALASISDTIMLGLIIWLALRWLL